MNHVEDDRAVWKGAFAGLVGGLIASWVMNQFQSGLSRVSRAIAAGQGDQPGSPQSADDDATMRAAEAISAALFGRNLTTQEKRMLGPLLHYAFGATVGAMYGAAAELAPRTTVAWGLPFGSAVWLGADEIAVPAFGLSKPSREYPVSTHVSALAAHLVYGFASDVVRRGVRAAL